jgi:beta-lactamase class A
MKSVVEPQFAVETAAFVADVEAIERECGGRLRFAARDLRTGATLRYHADTPCKTASVIKLPILIHVALAVREGALDWFRRAEAVDGGAADVAP